MVYIYFIDHLMTISFLRRGQILEGLSDSTVEPGAGLGQKGQPSGDTFPLDSDGNGSASSLILGEWLKNFVNVRISHPVSVRPDILVSCGLAGSHQERHWRKEEGLFLGQLLKGRDKYQGLRALLYTRSKILVRCGWLRWLLFCCQVGRGGSCVVVRWLVRPSYVI